jgi:hypothetical protein
MRSFYRRSIRHPDTSKHWRCAEAEPSAALSLTVKNAAWAIVCIAPVCPESALRVSFSRHIRAVVDAVEVDRPLSCRPNRAVVALGPSWQPALPSSRYATSSRHSPLRRSVIRPPHDAVYAQSPSSADPSRPGWRRPGHRAKAQVLRGVRSKEELLDRGRVLG